MNISRRTDWNRHDEALFVTDWAINPVGVAIALHNACCDCITEGVEQRDDPAVRLITYQLAGSVSGLQVSMNIQDWGDALEACKSRALKYGK